MNAITFAFWVAISIDVTNENITENRTLIKVDDRAI
jgi:hypothetical protein